MPTIDSADPGTLTQAQELITVQVSSAFVDHAYFGVFVLFVLSFIAFNYTLKIQRFISRKLAKKSNEKLKSGSL